MGLMKRVRLKKAVEKKRATELTPTRWHTNYPLNVLEPLKLRKGDRFLDIGSGPGLHVIGAWMGGAKATGIDFSPGNVLLGRKIATEVAAKPRRERRRYFSEFFTDRVMGITREIFVKTVPRSISRMEFLTATGSRLPIKSDSIDKVISLDTVHHIPSQRQRELLLEEVLRVAKLGSTIMIVSDPYLFGGKKAITASEHLRLVAEKSGARLASLPPKTVELGGRKPVSSAVPTFRLVHKPEEKKKSVLGFFRR